MGEIPKAKVELAGRSFADRATDALVGAERIVFVGPSDEAPAGSMAVQEEPPGSGPVAGIAAGIDKLSNEVIVVLAVDYPLIGASLVESLASDLRGDGRILVDPEGRDQPLAGAYRKKGLETALARLQNVVDVAVSELVIGLKLERVQGGAAAVDCDTPEDLAFLQGMADTERTGDSFA